MLFDLQGRRKSAVKAVYLGLAILMGGGLILFGIGSNTNGGLADLFNGGGGGTGAVKKQLKKDQKAVAKHPANPKLVVNVIADRYQLAGTKDNFDQVKGRFTADGKAQLKLLLKDWGNYQKVAGANLDTLAIGYAVRAYIGLEDAAGAKNTQLLLAAKQPNANNYLQLMEYAIYAGDQHITDLAELKAKELASTTQMTTVNDAIKQLHDLSKKRSADISKQIQQQFAAQQQNATNGQPQSPFGNYTGPPAGK